MSPRPSPIDRIPERVRRLGPVLGPPLGLLLVQQLFFPAPPGILVRGVIIGGLTALLALGMALIYRASRIVNFAQADLGGVSATLAVVLATHLGVGYVWSALAGLLSSIAVGAVVELAIIRRFQRSPRLVLTVATIGLAQLLAAAALLLPNLWDARLIAARLDPPIDISFTVDPIVLSANDLIAAAVVPIAIIALGFFLQATPAGIAIRASADRSARALTLGIPVQRLQTMVWIIAAVLAFTATFLRAGILGLPIGSALSLGVLLRALAALMLGRLTNLAAITTSAVALGVLELAVSWNVASPLLLDPILAAVIVVSLMLQRRDSGRTDVTSVSSWQSADDVRPIPAELRRVAVVRAVRVGIGITIAALAVGLPLVLAIDQSLKASAVLVYAILGLSLVVLTGWSGQVSLGQVAFFAIGGALGAKATTAWHLDLALGLLLAAGVGAAVAVVVGLPALRLRGLYLAVTTFAFALAATSWLLNPRFFDWIPEGRFERARLFGRLDISSATAMYYVCLGGLVVASLAVLGIRSSPTGRALIALRENERAAQAYGINAARAKLTAFAISGAIASFAGALFVQHQQAFGQGPFDANQNLAVFTMVVVGGIGSISGALFGALFLKGIQWFLPSEWQFLASGVGILFVLLVLPSGLGGLVFRLRDVWLRRVARQKGIRAPSLLADTATADAPVAVRAARLDLGAGPEARGEPADEVEHDDGPRADEPPPPGPDDDSVDARTLSGTAP